MFISYISAFINFSIIYLPFPSFPWFLLPSHPLFLSSTNIYRVNLYMTDTVMEAEDVAMYEPQSLVSGNIILMDALYSRKK